MKDNDSNVGCYVSVLSNIVKAEELAGIRLQNRKEGKVKLIRTLGVILQRAKRLAREVVLGTLNIRFRVVRHDCHKANPGNR